MSAAETYNERLRSPYSIPCDATYDYPSTLRFVAAPDYCSRCDEIAERDFESQLDHYCTVEHIAEAFGVDEAGLLRTARQLRVLEALEQA